MQHALDMGVQALRDEFRALAKYTHPEMTVTAFKKNHEFQKNRLGRWFKTVANTVYT